MSHKSLGTGRNYSGMEQEDYLQTILLLERKDGGARISDIAKVLKVQKPSVSQMMARLEKQAFITHKHYGDINLTKKGRSTAQAVLERREALTDFFTTIGISKKIQEKDIHGIEHYLSPATLKKLREITRFLKSVKR